MPPWTYAVAGGSCLLPALAALAVAVVATGVARRRWARGTAVAVGALSLATVAISAPGWPSAFVIAAGLATAAWIIASITPGRRAAPWRVGSRLVALAITTVAGGLEWDAERLSPLPPGRSTTLCVVGDSISAGLGRPGERTWPTLLREAHGLRVVDRSRAGRTVAQAAASVGPIGHESGVVVVEVGGNDLIGRADPDQFGADLDDLVRRVAGQGRQVVMVELPRFPFTDAYGRQQRRVARRYGACLVPRQRFAAVLAGPGATTDGVHLSNAGQRRMADLIWQVVGPAMGG